MSIFFRYIQEIGLPLSAFLPRSLSLPHNQLHAFYVWLRSGIEMLGKKNYEEKEEEEEKEVEKKGKEREGGSGGGTVKSSKLVSGNFHYSIY